MTSKPIAPKFLLLAIFLLSGFFRLYGLNWDQNSHLHPDERFLTMVAGALHWPRSLSGYLDTSASPLNPHNAGFNFYVYGTYPVHLVKYVAEVLGAGDYNNLTLVGRALSALTDLGTLLLVFLISRRLFSSPGPALLSALFYGLAVLPIQLSHFFAVDPYLVFFLTLSFYLLIRLIKQPSLIHFVFLGLSFSLAVAAKITAAMFAPLICLGFVIAGFSRRDFRPVFAGSVAFLLTAFLTLRLTLPYLFADSVIFTTVLNPRLLDNWSQLKSFDDPDGWFPPAIMWIATRPYLFPLENILLWGLGLPLGATALLSLVHVLARYRRHLLFLSFLWIAGMFAYQGGQFVKALRYFYPIYPFLAVTSGFFVFDIIQNLKRRRLVLVVFCSLLLVWPLAFISVYSRPHSRIAASAWIYKNIPPGSRLSCEHWDDCLPLGGPGSYQIIQYSLYDPDTSAKWQEITTKLAQTDYIVLTSNRLYGSISSVPGKYPVASRFYRELFAGSLGFIKIAEFTSRPNLPLPRFHLCLTPPGISYGAVAFPSQKCPLSGISFVDDYADESFTVYDHPKVIIFQKQSSGSDFLSR